MFDEKLPVESSPFDFVSIIRKIEIDIFEIHAIHVALFTLIISVHPRLYEGWSVRQKPLIGRVIFQQKVEFFFPFYLEVNLHRFLFVYLMKKHSTRKADISSFSQ